MNQSNKALREALIDIMIDEDRDASYETGWGLDVEKAADRAIALVTNYIKGLPSLQSEWEEDIHGLTNHNGIARNELRQQILKEMGHK